MSSNVHNNTDIIQKRNEDKENIKNDKYTPRYGKKNYKKI